MLFLHISQGKRVVRPYKIKIDFSISLLHPNTLRSLTHGRQKSSILGQWMVFKIEIQGNISSPLFPLSTTSFSTLNDLSKFGKSSIISTSRDEKILISTPLSNSSSSKYFTYTLEMKFFTKSFTMHAIHNFKSN